MCPANRSPPVVSSLSTAVITADASAGWLTMSPALNWSPASPLVNGYAGAATMNPAAAHFVVMLANDSGLADRPWLNRTSGNRPDAAAAFALGDPPADPVAGYHTSGRCGRLPRLMSRCRRPTAKDVVGAWPVPAAGGRAMVVRGAGGRLVVPVVVGESEVGAADGLTVGPPLVLDV